MDNLRDVVETVDKLEAIGRVIGNNGNANVNINAGGIGVWVSTTCCVVMLVALVILLVDRSDLRSDIRELRQNDQVLQAYINAGTTPVTTKEVTP